MPVNEVKHFIGTEKRHLWGVFRRRRNENKNIQVRPRRDSNSQSSDPKSDALSIRPRGLVFQLNRDIHELQYFSFIKDMYINKIFHIFSISLQNLVIVHFRINIVHCILTKLFTIHFLNSRCCTSYVKIPYWSKWKSLSYSNT